MNQEDVLEKLMVITNRKQMCRPLPEWTEELCAAGVRLIQLREKELDAAALYHLALQMRRITAHYGTKLLINDRADVALAVEADGVVIPETGFPIQVVKKINPKFLVAKSVHSIEGAKAAQEHGAHFIIFGHIFETESKPALPPRGLAALKDVVQSVKIPVFAVGGITAANAKLCLEHGAFGVAVISEVATAVDVTQRVQALLRALVQPAASLKSQAVKT